MGSDLLERIIRLSSAAQVDNFLRKTISHRWAHLIMHTYASHVFDTAVSTLVARDETSGNNALAREAITEIATWLIADGEWSQLTTSRYACPCLKNLVEVMGKVNVDEKLRSKFRHHIIQNCDIEPVVGTPFGSSLIQHILLDETGDLASAVASFNNAKTRQAPAAAVVPLPANLATPCFDSVFDLLTANKDFFQKSAKDQAMSRLVEVIISILTRKSAGNNAADSTRSLISLYTEHFRHNLVNLCKHPVANFVVQKLIEASGSSLPFFKLILAELQDNLFQLFRTAIYFQGLKRSSNGFVRL